MSKYIKDLKTLRLGTDFEDKEFLNAYLSQTRLKRKYIFYKGEEYLLELDQSILDILKERKREASKKGFKKFVETKRERFNEMVKGYMRNYYRNNKEKVSQIMKRWYANKKAKIAEEKKKLKENENNL